jgi:phosphoenolpyruvate carboxylase
MKMFSLNIIFTIVFITLPFDSVDNTGLLLPLFTEVCEKDLKNQKPKRIMDFFKKILTI